MTIRDKLAALPAMNVRDLLVRYAEVFGDKPRTHNKDWLVKRISWRIQAQSMGGLTERAKLRAAELANEADLRVLAPATIPMPTTTIDNRDARLPLPGSVITRTYKGQTYQVEVLANGFCWNDTTYLSLSGVATAITRQHVNGFHFFGLSKENA